MLVLGHCSTLQLIALHRKLTTPFRILPSCTPNNQPLKITNLNKFQHSNKPFQYKTLDGIVDTKS